MRKMTACIGALVLMLSAEMMVGCSQGRLDPTEAEVHETTETEPKTQPETQPETQKEEKKESWESPPDMDSDTIQWFCSAYAIYTHFNGKDLGAVGGLSEQNKYVRAAIMEALYGGWEIYDQESAAEKIDWLLTEGHRTKYRMLARQMQEEGILDMPEKELRECSQDDGISLYRKIAISRAWHAFGEQGIDAWDYCRALQVLGDCYQAGYINLEECLDQSLVIAEKLQSTYGSWEEAAQSYLYGYTYWMQDNPDLSWSESGKRYAVFEELKEMENGPYSVPYDMELTATWKDAAGI